MNRKYRHTLIAGNWKMNMLTSEIKGYADELRPLITGHYKWCDAAVCVPYICIHTALRAFRSCRVSIGAQNMSEHESGAYTGEVSGAQIKDIGARYVIIGHSERRELYGETNETVNVKIHEALDRHLKPIICVGESLAQREAGVTNDLVTLQVKAALHGVKSENLRNTTIAYEPIWAIGTGRTATPQDAQEVCAEIRSVVRSLYGARAARAMTIVYGGSMNDKNAFELLAEPDIDGGLIGGASLKPASFAAIVNAANQ